MSRVGKAGCPTPTMSCSVRPALRRLAGAASTRALICAAAAAWPGAAARAEESAKARYEQARRLFAEGDCAAAAPMFEELFAAVGRPELLFNAAQARRLAGEGVEAVESYRRFLQAGPSEPLASEARRIADTLALALSGGADPTALEGIPPRISHAIVPEHGGGRDLRIEARVADASGVFELQVAFRRAGEPGWRRSSLVPEAATGRWTAVIPVPPAGTLEYFLEATDLEGAGPSRHGTPSLPHRVEVRAEAPAPEPSATVAEAAPLPPEPVPDVVPEVEANLGLAPFEPLPALPAAALEPVARPAPVPWGWLGGATVAVAGAVACGSVAAGTAGRESFHTSDGERVSSLTRREALEADGWALASNVLLAAAGAASVAGLASWLWPSAPAPADGP